ncbi:expressed unknown protein [Seminavis robusta]|uniref:Uncharacterized protein n=1 Tax=Seminavis robusta TaxID=568900 RepID=A0A9N8ETD9_9STRA|nr:expressed unknown protein [Seminavis robusta]|eukprot:Sro1633_g287390.1 n/a (174) ;mRNA; f:12546-13067
MARLLLIAALAACSVLSASAVNLRTKVADTVRQLEAPTETFAPTMESTAEESFDPSLLQELLEWEMGDDDGAEMDDQLADMDDELLEEAEEFLFDEDEEYNGCFCECMEERDANYAPETVKMYDVASKDPMCVSDIDSVVLNKEGLALCDDQCLLEDLDSQEEEDAKEGEEDN